MIDYFSYWYLFLVGILISSFYSSTGLSGANFWAPVYLIWIKLDPLIGFWVSLISMLFGSLGGLIGHLRQHTINFYLVKKYLIITVPSAILGSILIPYIELIYLFLIFGTFVFTYGIILIIQTIRFKDNIITKREKIHYYFGAIGGFLTGLISIGLGKLILPQCIKHKKIVHHSEAIGTTLVIVFFTSFVAVLVRLNSVFIETLNDNKFLIISMLLYVIPGVIIGGQIGPKIAKKLNIKSLKIYISILLIVIGILMLLRGFFQ